MSEAAPHDVIPPQLNSEEPAESPAPKIDKTQERINQLVGAAKEAQAAADSANGANAQILEQLAQLSTAVQSLQAKGAPSADQPTDPFSTPDAERTSLTPEKVKEIVAETLRPAQQAQESAAQLRAEQQQSFNSVCDEMPELRNPASEEHRIFAKIYDSPTGQQLQQLFPNAPALVAAMTRDTLSGSRTEARATELAKQRAGTQVTLPGGKSTVPDALEYVDEKLKEVYSKASTGGGVNDLEDIIHLSLAKQSLSRK